MAIRRNKSATFDELDKPRFFASGAALYTGMTTVLYPLHTMKTRSQAQGLASAATPPARSGVLHYFAGWPTVIAGAVPARIGYILALETGSLYSSRWARDGGMSAESAATLGGALGGASAALTSMFLFTPFDVVSQRQIVDPAKARQPALSIARSIAAAEGAAGLYRGFSITAMTYLPSSALWWGTFKAAHEVAEQSAPEWAPVYIDAIAGAVAGAVTAALTSPLDTIKTRTQVQAKRSAATFMHVALELWRSGGVAGLWRGVPYRCAHTVVWGTSMIILYEKLKRWARKPAIPAASQKTQATQ